MVTNDVDPRLIKAVRPADAERQRRITAERQASALRAEHTRLKRAIVHLRQRDAAKPAAEAKAQAG